MQRYFLFCCFASLSFAHLLPTVINTWPFVNATAKAWSVVWDDGGSALDAVEQGCTVCEQEQCDGTVGFGGSPDESGETTLDAMIMDGVTHDVGAVGALRQIKQAISVARCVLNYTEETLLVGDQATQFAVDMGFERTNLTTNGSLQKYQSWLENNCQPNYWKDNVAPNSTTTCGPYAPNPASRARARANRESTARRRPRPLIDRYNHDTIGMAVIDRQGNIASGTSTNGASHKIAGRVGDGPITGAGSYADNEVGACAATGDGDVMVRFLPCYQAVENMRLGMDPTTATEDAIRRIERLYPDFVGAIVAVNKQGQYGGACHGWVFTFSVMNPSLPNVTVMTVQPI